MHEWPGAFDADGSAGVFAVGGDSADADLGTVGGEDFDYVALFEISFDAFDTDGE